MRTGVMSKGGRDPPYISGRLGKFSSDGESPRTPHQGARENPTNRTSSFEIKTKV